MHVRTIAAPFAAVLLASAPLAATRVATAATFPEERSFDQAAFDAAQKAGEPILVHVTASWCTTCAAQKPIVDKLLSEPGLRGCGPSTWISTRRRSSSTSSAPGCKARLSCSRARRRRGAPRGETKPEAIKALLDQAL